MREFEDDDTKNILEKIAEELEGAEDAGEFCLWLAELLDVDCGRAL